MGVRPRTKACTARFTLPSKGIRRSNSSDTWPTTLTQNHAHGLLRLQQYITTTPTRSQQLGSTRPHVSSLIAPTPAPWALRPKTTHRPPRPQKHTLCVATPQKNGAKSHRDRNMPSRHNRLSKEGLALPMLFYTFVLRNGSPLSRPWSEQHHEE